MNRKTAWATVLVIMGMIVVPGMTTGQPGNASFRGGLEAYYQEDYETAKSRFQDAMEETSDQPRLNFFLANSFRNLDQFKQAIQSYKTVLDLDPSHRSARQNLADIFLQQKQWERAAKQIEELLNRHEEQYQWHFDLGRSYLKQGELSDAQEQFLSARGMRPKKAEVYYQLGRVLMKKGERLNAASRFSKAIELDPGEGKYYFHRARAFFEEEDYKRSADERWKSGRDFKMAIERGRDSPRIHFMYGNTLLNRGLIEKQDGDVERAMNLFYRSIDQYRAVLSGDWKASNAYHNMGIAYLAIGKLDMARQSVEEAIMQEPSVPFFHDTMGMIYFRLGTFNKAIQSWELVTELESSYDGHPFQELMTMESLADKIEAARIRQ